MQFKINSFEGRVKVKYFCIIYLIFKSIKTTADYIARLRERSYIQLAGATQLIRNLTEATFTPLSDYNYDSMS